ncbi:hypothetical protein ACJMK2_015190 [Sinanodonta woodiana]|uniref:Uncharacterized protein n=1 Tax=Sinanodonta woodiana TaxID=1069815 RepID=A0ABD3V5I6_SINWO
MVHKESPRDVIAPDKDAHLETTSVLCWIIRGKCILLEIFHRLIAACLARWPVAKNNYHSESLIFHACTVFDLDPVHRLILHSENQAVFARIISMGIDHVNTKMCTRVRKFITLNLSTFISRQDPNFKYQLCVQNVDSKDSPEHLGSRVSPPLEMWFVEEVSCFLYD